MYKTFSISSLLNYLTNTLHKAKWLKLRNNVIVMMLRRAEGTPEIIFRKVRRVTKYWKLEECYALLQRWSHFNILRKCLKNTLSVIHLYWYKHNNILNFTAHSLGKAPLLHKCHPARGSNHRNLNHPPSQGTLTGHLQHSCRWSCIWVKVKLSFVALNNKASYLSSPLILSSGLWTL